MSRLTRDGTPNPSRETKFSGAKGDREAFIFPVQLITSRIGNHTRLVHTILYMIIIDTYIHTNGGTSNMPTHTNSGPMVMQTGSTRYRNYVEDYWSCAGGLSAVNTIGTQ